MQKKKQKKERRVCICRSGGWVCLPTCTYRNYLEEKPVHSVYSTLSLSTRGRKGVNRRHPTTGVTEGCPHPRNLRYPARVLVQGTRQPAVPGRGDIKSLLTFDHLHRVAAL